MMLDHGHSCRKDYLVINHSVRRVRNSAFTLIELLVVIAIIAIIAAILFPVFAQARGEGRKASCISNSKQLGTAILMYAQDFDELYPMSFYGTSASNTWLSWPTIIQPNVKNTQIFVCPDVAQVKGTPPGTDFPVTYGYNYYIGGNNNPTTGVMNFPMAGVVKPSETVMLVDSGVLPVTTAPPDKWPLMLNPTRRYAPWLLVHAGSNLLNPNLSNHGAPHARHAGSVASVNWCDGHVKARKVESFYTLPGQEVPDKPEFKTPSWSPCLDPDYGCR
jgi:prepilin-type N-terminal cleavage/methylation domain-containing protein/prepilin-type processing-associated H-X9-DG protein